MNAVPDTDDGLSDEEELLLSDPDMSEVEVELVTAALGEPRLSAGRMVQHFESSFARWVGRKHAVAVSSGTVGTWLALRALDIGPGDEVIASPYSWHQVAHAVELTGARVVFSDINYWSGCLDPVRAADRITPATKAILAGNTNGHPAAWDEFRKLADEQGIWLIEDSTEALGSRLQGKLVGSFGDLSVFDFSQPSALCCGEGGMVVTDDDALASELRYLRSRSLKDRRSISVGSRVPLQALMSEITAALGAGQLGRIDRILDKRKAVEASYLLEMQSFEGVKPPYVAPGVDEVHWMLYVVHLGKRFTASACNDILEDLETELIEAVMYCMPLHQQFHYMQQGWKRGDLPLTERIADRALALPLHTHLTPGHVKFIVKTLKDSSINVGAGAAIYL
ncbi:DegT/DnrJ/EryC1/StrS aminotransferase family protein [uncultured Azohydromonas sp.]|jgi:Predicted pyridoxal phosphate-dependent enzyme apparently involved in regulation of cell wall biogenesis|uniref:DegT/DnrJ/EryC1/StrS family aminotransferase n=1 Tax=uncultured Azohydromonas sp. TaxID=487342 RepID=UPI0026180483|nr:DegT/DnrJ/EryC1/StrS family aminotransferase [uncultured Azohydromonas sp.]